MRDTEANAWIVQSSSRLPMRALRLAVVALGIGLVMTAGAARAEDDEDDKTFEEKIIEGIMAGIGGNKAETAPWKGEPTRESLTQPPSGYQTPSPNFAYGTGPKESMNKEYNPAAGKYGE